MFNDAFQLQVGRSRLLQVQKASPACIIVA